MFDRLTQVCLVALLVLWSASAALAFLPYECVSDMYLDDFKESPLIVIGRVTAIERYRTNVPPRMNAKPDTKQFFYVATIAVGRSLKGDAKPGQELLFFMGFSGLREDDNLHSRILVVANTHSGWDLDVDNAYLLCLRRTEYLEDKAHAEVRRGGVWQNAGLEKRDVWEPRSCHNSVHRIASGRDPVHVSVSLEHPRSRSEKCVPLDAFITELKKGRIPAKEDRALPRTSTNEKR